MRSRLAAALILCAAPVAAEDPLSAIDWLSESVASPVAQPTPRVEEPPVAGGAGPETITVTPLDQVSADAVGLLPVSVTGLPRDLWGPSSSEVLARQISALPTGDLMALRELLLTLLLAELDPPTDSDPSSRLFLARIDALLALGGVEQAQSLLRRAGPDMPETFRRWFDTSLLLGTENDACRVLKSTPNLSARLPARIFCLVRDGDYGAALLTLETARALGQLTGAEDALLTRFLDPELFEGAPPLPVPSRPSPLVYRLHEGIGEALPASTLPVAFATADLQGRSGWKPQVEAAERLARTGVIDGNALLKHYTERRPAASGGVWDRVAALQRFEAAIVEGAPDRIAATLPAAWFAMRQVGLQPVFARLYAPALADIPLAGDAGALAFRIALLSEDYETAAQAREPETAEERFLKAVARGVLAGAVPPSDLARAVLDGFTGPPPADLAAEVADGALGAAILGAMSRIADGAEGDLGQLSAGLALLRDVGLEDVARRTALELLVLGLRR